MSLILFSGSNESNILTGWLTLPNRPMLYRQIQTLGGHVSKTAEEFAISSDSEMRKDAEKKARRELHPIS